MAAPNTRQITVREGFDFLKRLLWGRPLYRFFTAILVLGGSLVAGPGIWELLLEVLIGVVWPEDSNTTLIAQLIGAALCVAAIALFVVFHHLDQARERQAARREADRAFKEEAAALMGAIDHLLAQFEDSAVGKPAGYRSDDIKRARDLARTVHDRSPPTLRQNATLTGLMRPGIDASGRQAVFELSSQDLRALRDELGRHIGEKRQ